MPTFCRHNRFIQNCPICREPEAPKRSRSTRSSGATRATGGSAGTRRRGGGAGLRVRQAPRQADDGYRGELVPGIRLAADARRLAGELAFSAVRLAQLATAPPGLYAEVASLPDDEEALWLAFLIAYVCPTEGDDPFAGVRAARTAWRSGELPALADVPTGPRTAHEPDRGGATLEAYRGWASRAGSQLSGLTGEEHWTDERRFERAFERLSLPGLDRSARFDFLVTLGRLGRVPMRAGTLRLGASDRTSLAAKRVFGIADPLLLDRRAQDLAEECELPLEALDLALFNWADENDRATLGAGVSESDPAVAARVESALGL